MPTRPIMTAVVVQFLVVEAVESGWALVSMQQGD